MDPLSDASETTLTKRSNYSTRDRLSNLPDLALDRILSHLFFHEAVKTSVLSKRFYSLWNSISTLYFSDEYSGKFGEFFVSFVDTALSVHRRREIDAFSVKFRHDFEYKKSVDDWIRFAVQKKVKSLFLNLYRVPDNGGFQAAGFVHALPDFLYINDDLVELVLSRCKLSSDALIRWNSLKLLSLTRANLDEDLISRVLRGCHVLETLELREWSGIDKLKIDSASLKVLRIAEELHPKYEILPNIECSLKISGPNLLSLEVSGSLYRTKLQMSDVGCLMNATMDFQLKRRSHAWTNSWFQLNDQDVAREVLESLCLVKTLTLGGWFVKVVSYLEAFNLPTPWSERRSLTLSVPVTIWDHRGIASLLQSSPFLETLAIKLSCCSDMCIGENVLRRNVCDEEGEGYYWKVWNTISKCPVLHLKTVKVYGFRETCRSMKPLFQFLEFLLRNSRVLEEIVIQATRYMTLQTINEALKLLTVPAASPDAVVLYEPPRLWVDALSVS